MIKIKHLLKSKQNNTYEVSPQERYNYTHHKQWNKGKTLDPSKSNYVGNLYKNN